MKKSIHMRIFLIKIKEYQSKDGSQNERGLERYIDKILTEKAEKNGNV